MLNKIRKNIRSFFTADASAACLSVKRDIRSLQSLFLIQKYLKGGFFPISEYSINPEVILSLLNDIYLLDVKYVLEFGSGLSTICLANFIVEENIDCKLISVESDKEWLNILQKATPHLSSEKRCHFIYAPIREVEFKNNTALWYDVGVLDTLIGDEDLKFDIVLIDGPPGDIAPGVRQNALHYLKNRMSESCVVYVDDCHRDSEKKLAEKIAYGNKRIKWIGDRCVRIN